MRIDYICLGCAALYGAQWSEGHSATWHKGQCDNCKSSAGLCSVTDWNWPNGIPAKWREK